MAKQPPISEEILRGISQVIGDTSTGLSGAEIGHLLANAKIADTDPTLTKWKRLFNAFCKLAKSEPVFEQHLRFYIEGNESCQLYGQR